MELIPFIFSKINRLRGLMAIKKKSNKKIFFRDHMGPL